MPDAARHHADVVGDIGRERWVTEQEQRRKGHQGARADDDVDRAGPDPGREDHDGFEQSAVQRREPGQAPVEEVDDSIDRTFLGRRRLNWSSAPVTGKT